MVDPLSHSSPPNPGATPRTRVRRLPERAVSDREVLHAVLDAGLVAHVAVVDGTGQPFVLPVAYAREGDRVLFHGSTGSRLFRTLAAGASTCLTVTLLDGLVVARSAFESSMNYRSAIVLGRCRRVTGSAKAQALRAITEHLMPGRWDDVRPPLRKELAATTVLELPLDECSVKVRTGGPEDPPEDVAGAAWAGIVPLTARFGAPVAADDLRPDIPVPGYVDGWTRP